MNLTAVQRSALVKIDLNKQPVHLPSVTASALANRGLVDYVDTLARTIPITYHNDNLIRLTYDGRLFLYGDRCGLTTYEKQVLETVKKADPWKVIDSFTADILIQFGYCKEIKLLGKLDTKGVRYNGSR